MPEPPKSKPERVIKFVRFASGVVVGGRDFAYFDRKEHRDIGLEVNFVHRVIHLARVTGDGKTSEATVPLENVLFIQYEPREP